MHNPDHFCDYCNQPMKEYQLFTSTYWACPLCEAHGRTVGGKVPAQTLPAEPPRQYGQAPSLSLDHTADRGAGPCFQDGHNPNLIRHQLPGATSGCSCGHFKDLKADIQAQGRSLRTPDPNRIVGKVTAELHPFTVGRFSCKEPNAQTLPREETADYGKLEERVMALAPGEKIVDPEHQRQFLSGRRFGKSKMLEEIVNEWKVAFPNGTVTRIHDEYVIEAKADLSADQVEKVKKAFEENIKQAQRDAIVRRTEAIKRHNQEKLNGDWLKRYAVGPEQFRREYLCQWEGYKYREDDVVLNGTKPLFTAKGRNGRWTGLLEIGDTIRLNGLSLTIGATGQYRLSTPTGALTIEHLAL